VADADRALFVAGLEVALADAYRVVLDRGGLDDAAAEVLLVLAQHHDEHASALAAVARRPRSDVVANATWYAELNQTLLGSSPLDAARAAEESLAATHLVSLRLLTAATAASAVAAILPVEAQHSIAVAAVAGVAVTDPTLHPGVAPVDGALAEARYG